VFERFHRVDAALTRQVNGLGLGLAMCARIAELHGGSIWAESGPGMGSVFYLSLPALARDSDVGAVE
jgi:signal transduction histidine kinase